MLQDVRSTVKQIVKLDLLVALITVTVLLIMTRQYVPIVLLGLASAIFNFYLSSFVTCNMLLNQNRFSMFRHILGYTARIILVACLGLICFIQNKYNIFFFVLGYILHFVGLSLYGIRLQITSRGE